MKITVETATLIDSLRKAEAIAPKRGNVSDTTYGIILESNVEDQSFTAKATDGVFFYVESIPILSIDGQGATTWRVPSSVFYGAVSKLPSRVGSQVTIEAEDNFVTVKSNRTLIKIPTMPHETFPEFDFYDPSEFHDFTNITGKSNRLKWTTSNIDNDSKSCVYVHDDRMFATDRYKAARILLDKPTGITALYPPVTLTRVISLGANVKVSKQDNLLVISPDDYSQLCMATMDDSDYPWKAIDKMLDAEMPYSSSVPKSEFLRMLDGAAPLVGKRDDSQPLTLFLGRGELAVYFQSEDGVFGDRIEAQGSCTKHSRFKFLVTHSFIRSVVDSVGDNVIMEYAEFGKSLRFNDGTYKAIIQLRKE